MHLLDSVRTDVRAQRASTALAAEGCAVSLIDLEPRESKREGAIPPGIAVTHILVPGTFVATRFKRWALIRAIVLFLRCTVQLLRMPADVYHALDLPALPACYVAARLRRKSLVFESYELPLQTLAPGERGLARRMLDAIVGRLLPLMIRRCAAVIAVSPPIVEVIRQRYGHPNVRLIRNVPVYREVARSDRLRAHLGLGSETRIALYQGYVQADRGLDRLVLAAAALASDTMIAIMGKAVPSTQAELEALIERTGVSDRVRLLPPVPYAELLDWTASADIGLIVYPPGYAPNVAMMLPNKLFEYLMAGVPVLASDLVSVTEVITTYDVGRVLSSPEPAAIAEAITSMLADRGALARMRINALEASRRVFSWDREREELVQLYWQIAAAHV
jgi:glycosyltransferase involved in cell wall biosynthesis